MIGDATEGQPLRVRAIAAGLVGVALLGFGVWLASLPPGNAASPNPVPEAENIATLEALRPPKRKRPLIAVIGINDATETTDYLMPTGILRRADIADVQLVATQNGPVSLYPALTVEPDATIAAFDAANPEGADYVIVPAMSRDDDPAVLGWLRRQAAKGSVIIGVCAGAKVVAAAGLLDGRRATTHWFYLKDMLKRHPGITYVPDRRYVVDDSVATTTGISASMPMTLTLFEAIAGREKAAAVAAEIGISRWDASHDSTAFTLTRPFALTVMANVMRLWQREQVEFRLQPGFDVVSLALAADAWSRTYRSKASTVARDAAPVADRDGIRIVPDRVAAGEAPPSPGAKPATALDQALQDIAARYGDATAYVVAMQLEYPWPVD